MKDKTIRAKMKWAKVSGFTGRYTVAFGFTSEIKAVRTQHHSTMAGALIAAQNWIDDQP